MTTFNSSREIPATPEQVYVAISTPDRLARWWGPAGFTNQFHICDFRPGGRWVFDMVGPDGTRYANDSVFAEIEPGRRVVIAHACEPFFRLTLTLWPVSTGTRVDWQQDFENAQVAQQVVAIVVPANEQNLDRLTAEVARGPSA